LSRHRSSTVEEDIGGRPVDRLRRRPGRCFCRHCTGISSHCISRRVPMRKWQPRQIGSGEIALAVQTAADVSQSPTPLETFRRPEAGYSRSGSEVAAKRGRHLGLAAKRRSDPSRQNPLAIDTDYLFPQLPTVAMRDGPMRSSACCNRGSNWSPDPRD
jgi:hypothetical protein